MAAASILKALTQHATSERSRRPLFGRFLAPLIVTVTPHLIRGLGFRVWGLRFQGSGVKGLKVWGLRVEGLRG